MPAGVVIDDFSKDSFFFSGTLQFSRTDRIYRCCCRLLFSFFFPFATGPAGPLVGVRFLRVAILSICTIIALIHPSRCLREKREKGCENWGPL